VRFGYEFRTKTLLAERVDAAPVLPDDPASLEGASGVDWGFADLSGLQSRDARTCVAAAHDSTSLYFLVGWTVNPLDRSLQLAASSIPISGSHPGDFVSIYIDPAHDHTHFVRLDVYANGRIDAFRGMALPTEYPWRPGYVRSEFLPRPAGVRAVWRRSAGFICCQVAIDWGWLLGSDQQIPPCVGLNVVRTVLDRIALSSVWQRTGPYPEWLPLAYGHLHLDATLPAIERVSFPEPVIGHNNAHVVLRSLHKSGADRWRLEARTILPPTGESWEFRGEFVDADSRGLVNLSCRYFLSPKGTWLVEPSLLMRLDLVARSESGRVMPLGSWVWSVDAGLIPDEAYGQHSESGPPDPRDPDFALKKRLQIVGRIPRFRRLTTAQGAPSDFYLRAEDGSVEFDLMCPGGLKKIADWLYGLFDNDCDRLLAATMFVHQRSITRHSGHNPAGPSGPLSLMRGGSCLCGDRANVLCGILSRMKCDRTGRPFETYVMGMHGHVVTAVAWEGDFIILDPDTATLFFSRDNSRPATLSELRSDESVVRRACAYTRRHGHDFYYQAYHQFLRPFRAGGRWPEGAPVE